MKIYNQLFFSGLPVVVHNYFFLVYQLWCIVKISSKRFEIEFTASCLVLTWNTECDKAIYMPSGKQCCLDNELFTGVPVQIFECDRNRVVVCWFIIQLNGLDFSLEYLQKWKMVKDLCTLVYWSATKQCDVTANDINHCHC